MLKKDVDQFRKQLKLDNPLLTIHELLNVYVVKESKEVYFHKRTSFEMLSKDEQELFIQNFRKTLMGRIDQKLFTFRFQDEGTITSQRELYDSLSLESDEWTEQMIKLVQKRIELKPYETDMVYTFIRGEYITAQQEANTYEEVEESFVNPFILCTINETKSPDNELLFDYVEKEFTYHIEVNPVINLQAPIHGFLFPSFTNGLANVNELLFTTKKAYVLDSFLIDEVLQVEEGPTAEDEKLIFSEVVKQVAGDQLNRQTLQTMYEVVHHKIVDHEENEEVKEPLTLDYRDLGDLLLQSGVQNVEQEAVKKAFQSVAQDANYEMKAENAIPRYTTKSLKIKTKIANFSLRPKDLEHVRQVQFNGKPYVMIELDESSEVDGFELIPEASLTEDK